MCESGDRACRIWGGRACRIGGDRARRIGGDRARRIWGDRACRIWGDRACRIRVVPRIWDLGLGAFGRVGQHRPQMLGNSQWPSVRDLGLGWRPLGLVGTGNPDARQLSVAERAGSRVAARLGGLGNIGPPKRPSLNIGLICSATLSGRAFGRV